MHIDSDENKSLTSDYAVPEALRAVGRFIPHAAPGKRAYAMGKLDAEGVFHPAAWDDPEAVSAYQAGKADGWWEWEPDADEYIRRIGGTMTGAPGGPRLVCLDLDVPIAPGGAVIADGMRTLADLAAIDGEILDTSGWIMVKTPGHGGDNPKAPGHHAWFLDDPDAPTATGAMPGHREIELKTLCTAPGSPGATDRFRAMDGTWQTQTSPGYVVTQTQDEVPLLPEWIRKRFGEAKPGRETTGETGWSVPEWAQEWARGLGSDPEPGEEAESEANPCLDCRGQIGTAEDGAWPPLLCAECMRGVPFRFFMKQEGLRADLVARIVRKLGPLAEGADGLLWAYQGGVWVPSKHAVRDRVTRLLGDLYRRAHTVNVEDVVRAGSPRISCEPIEGWVNFRNGLLDWRTLEMAPHDPGVLSTVQLGVEWARDAECPAFEGWLAEVLPADCIGLAWELIGYLMYSGNPLHTAVMLTGTGRNGKGTFLRVVKALLGERNVAGVTLADIANPNMRFSTVQLYGKIANIAGDIDAEFMRNTARFKAVTGGDMISAEHKGRDAFTFTPWAVPIFSANKIPPSADTTTGYLSRWLVLPFPHSFAGREDRTIEGRLMPELPGIAARGMRSLGALLDRGGWELPVSAREAKDEFAEAVDQVRTWARDCTAPGGWTPRTKLYEAYRVWCEDEGVKNPVRREEMYRRIEATGLAVVTRRGDRGFELTLAKDGAAVRWAQQYCGGTAVTVPSANGHGAAVFTFPAGGAGGVQ